MFGDDPRSPVSGFINPSSALAPWMIHLIVAKKLLSNFKDLNGEYPFLPASRRTIATANEPQTEQG
jgi:hypothetical protein